MRSFLYWVWVLAQIVVVTSLQDHGYINLLSAILIFVLLTVAEEYFIGLDTIWPFSIRKKEDRS